MEFGTPAQALETTIQRWGGDLEIGVNTGTRSR